MKQVLLVAMIAFVVSSCSLFRKNVKYGCPTDGRNVGAEKLLSGDPKSVKAARKAKYKGGSAVKSVY
jgi:hypothetical protein